MIAAISQAALDVVGVGFFAVVWHVALSRTGGSAAGGADCSVMSPAAAPYRARCASHTGWGSSHSGCEPKAGRVSR